MDKETLSNYGWIVICVLVLTVMIALAGPFGNFISEAVKSTTQGLFDVNQNAMDAAGIVIDDQSFWEAQNGAKIYYDRVYESELGIAIWHRSGDGEIYFFKFPDMGYTIPANLIKVESDKVSHPDLRVDDGRDYEYYPNEDGTIVNMTLYSYTLQGNTLTNKTYTGLLECRLTEYTSIAAWMEANGSK